MFFFIVLLAPCETCSRSGAMESHDSQPSQRTRHLMMMMMNNYTCHLSDFGATRVGTNIGCRDIPERL